MSLKGGIPFTVLCDTIEGVKKGRKKDFNKLTEYVRQGSISAKFYNEIMELHGETYKRKRKRKITLQIGAFLLVLCLVCILNAFAHSGRTDSNGGHWDKSTGTYHYHSGGKAKSTKSVPTSSSAATTDLYINEDSNKYDEGYDDGYSEGRSKGYNEGYDDGYDDGYKARDEEADAKRNKWTKILLSSILATVIVLLLFKFIIRKTNNT